VEHLARARLVHAVARELEGLIAAADAEVHAAVRHEVEQGEVLGHAQRVVERQHDDPGAQAHAPGLQREGRQRERRGGAVAVLGEVVLGRPHRVEAVGLGRPHQRELLVDDVPLGAARGILEEAGPPRQAGCR
jgi:hypothetical protein